jgi:phage tail sheath protein FI
MMPGRTTSASANALSAVARDYNRVALIDLPDNGSASAIIASSVTSSGTAPEYVGHFAPWLRAPGVIAGTTRIVPPSAAIAGLMARNDVANTAGTPAAGDNGVLRSITGLSQDPFTDPDRETLNYGGVNVIRPMFGDYRLYGYRSKADPGANPSWLPLNIPRYLMWLKARCLDAGEAFVFQVIDGAGRLQAEFAAALGSICQADYSAGIIYGATAEQAYNVDTGPSVNTPETIAAGELRAVVAVRPSPFAELVTILIVKTPITETVT